MIRDLCPFAEQSPERNTRLRCLTELHKTVGDFYLFFFERLNEPYSDEEQNILARIIEMFDSLLIGKVTRTCLCGKAEDCKIAPLCEQPGFIRLAFPAKDPFSNNSRLHLLGELERKIACLFVSYTGSKPYTFKERKVLRKIRKLLFHELKGTPKYELFKSKHVKRLSAEEEKELQLQKKDEALLEFVPILKCNPFSQKYKKVKQEKMMEIEEMKKKARAAKDKELEELFRSLDV